MMAQLKKVGAIKTKKGVLKHPSLFINVYEYITLYID
jgi:hypothetical protein